MCSPQHRYEHSVHEPSCRRSLPTPSGCGHGHVGVSQQLQHASGVLSRVGSSPTGSSSPSAAATGVLSAAAALKLWHQPWEEEILYRCVYRLVHRGSVIISNCPSSGHFLCPGSAELNTSSKKINTRTVFHQEVSSCPTSLLPDWLSTHHVPTGEELEVEVIESLPIFYICLKPSVNRSHHVHAEVNQRGRKCSIPPPRPSAHSTSCTSLPPRPAPNAGSPLLRYALSSLWMSCQAHHALKTRSISLHMHFCRAPERPANVSL